MKKSIFIRCLFSAIVQRLMYLNSTQAEHYQGNVLVYKTGKFFSTQMEWATFCSFPFFVWSLLTFCSFCLAQQQSHYDAARELMETLHEKAGAGFTDTVVNKIVAQKPTMKQHEDAIYEHIKVYLNSSAYEETRIKAIMHYFTEIEIRDITKIVNNPSFHNATGEQMALVKKYEKVFKRLEKLFIEYIQMKLDKKY